MADHDAASGDSVSEPSTLADYIKAENAREQREARGDLSNPTGALATTEPIEEMQAVTVDGKVGEQADEEADAIPSPERNPDGTFKAKPAEPAKPVKADKYGGDPRKDPQARIAAQAQRIKELETKLASGATPSVSESAGNARRAADAPAPTQPQTYAERVKRFEADPSYPKDVSAFAEFGDPYAAMLAAQAAYIQDQTLAERDAQSAAQAMQDRLREPHLKAQADGAKKYADWDDLMASDLAKTDLDGAVLDAIYDNSDLSADVIHHLLTNPAEMQALATVKDPIAARLIVQGIVNSNGLIAVQSDSAEQPRPVTRAKPLIKSVKASTPAPEAAPPEKMPFGKAYIDRMNALERKEREARRGA